ncbi:MAG: signal recognition particle-docking protein FtsY [Candidatus ainarchaeum sp.]|nr:signal recognition particle-docking protein FtsY [Candidatus ainarchaeum sp.]
MFDLLRQKLGSFVESFSRKEEERLEVELSLESRIKGAILGEITIKDKDVEGLLDELELSLLEADTSVDVAREVVQSIRAGLVGMKVKGSLLKESVRAAVAKALKEQMNAERPDLLALADAKREKPLKILFLGPNGAGKTTTMAKVARLFLKEGKTVVFAAGDSFRAAAIEQTEAHAERLGLKTIKHEYGADPAAVSFDAINYARAHGVDVVLMDSAGRQETNRNLMDELRKIGRVAKPDFNIFVGESIAGNAIVEQIKAFRQAIGVDGVVLTKLDCDAKGGTVLSIAKAAGVPVLFFGVGQGYDDRVWFDAGFVVSLILGE